MNRVTTHGKQIKLDGRHLADAISEEAAQALATALEYAGPNIPREREQPIKDLLA